MPTPLPKKYEWLANEKAPKMLVKALETYGTLETPGAGNTPEIIAWAQEVGGWTKTFYKQDSIPWCGLWMAVVAGRAGYPLPKEPLRALSWGTFGEEAAGGAKLGDTLVFTRKGGGHVGIYVGEDETHYHVLGGNQSDKVCIARFNKANLYTARRPKFKIGQPANVRKIALTSTGVVSDVSMI